MTRIRRMTADFFISNSSTSQPFNHFSGTRMTRIIYYMHYQLSTMNCQLLNQSTSQLREVPSPETSERVVKQIPFTCNSVNHNAIRVKWRERNERKETQVWMKRQIKKAHHNLLLNVVCLISIKGLFTKRQLHRQTSLAICFLVVQPLAVCFLIHFSPLMLTTMLLPCLSSFLAYFFKSLAVMLLTNSS